MRLTAFSSILLAPCLLCACIGGSNGTVSNNTPPPPTVNTLALIVDGGPPGLPAGSDVFNQAYVTVKVCVPGSTTQCANIDHVWLDTGSWGLRLVRSVLTAGGVTLAAETDANGEAIEECFSFAGGQTFGPVALADVTFGGEVAAKLPLQIMDDSVMAAPASVDCGNNVPLLNDVSGFYANGILGVGVLAQDCGPDCVTGTSPLAMYYGCTAAGACTPEKTVALAAQVTNPVTLFASDNNGLIVDLPKLLNADGDATVQGQVIFGLSTQADNTLPASGLTVLGADANGDFTASYEGAMAVAALIDSGNRANAFYAPDLIPNPTLGTNQCSSGNRFSSGYYCPTGAPVKVSAVNFGALTAAVPSVSNTVQFAVADPSTQFLSTPTTTAYTELAGGAGSSNFTWGMPFFYGQKIYIGIDKTKSGSYTGPYYAY
jgi:hypothetical protein